MKNEINYYLENFTKKKSKMTKNEINYFLENFTKKQAIMISSQIEEEYKWVDSIFVLKVLRKTKDSIDYQYLPLIKKLNEIVEEMPVDTLFTPEEISSLKEKWDILSGLYKKNLYPGFTLTTEGIKFFIKDKQTEKKPTFEQIKNELAHSLRWRSLEDIKTSEKRRIIEQQIPKIRSSALEKQWKLKTMFGAKPTGEDIDEMYWKVCEIAYRDLTQFAELVSAEIQKSFQTIEQVISQVSENENQILFQLRKKKRELTK